MSARLTFSILAVCCCTRNHLSAQVILSLSSATGSPVNTTRLDLTLDYTGAAPAALKWTLLYSPAQISGIVAAPGPVAFAAGKQLSCVSQPGLYRCLLTGLNATAIPPGLVATVYAGLTPNTGGALISLSELSAADGSANGLDIFAPATATIFVPSLTALTCTPAVLGSGETVSCLVTLNGPAPDGGITVKLSSNNPVAPVPASITIPAGLTAARFSVTAGFVGSSLTVTFTSTWNGGFTTGSISLSARASFFSMSCKPASLGSRVTGICSVAVSRVAPAEGYTFSVTSDSANLTVPPFVTVPAGSSGTSFIVQTGTVSNPESVTVTATLNPDSQKTVVMLQPAAAPALTSVVPNTISAGGPGFTVTVNGAAFSASTLVQWNGTPLSARFLNSGQLEATVPATLIATSGIAKISVFSPDTGFAAALLFTIRVPGPAIAEGGIVPLGSTVPVIQPSSWFSIYGKNLAPGTVVWNGDFPTSLGGVSVTVNGKPGYLWFVSPGQINLQAPDDTAAGTVAVVVTTPAGQATSTVTLSPFAPSFVLFDATYPAAIILTPDGSGSYGNGAYDLPGPSGHFNFNTRPAVAGETIELYGTGFGPSVPPVPAGRSFQGGAPIANDVSVTIGGVPAKVVFAGITNSGLYQIDVVVPVTDSGDQFLQAGVGGALTPDHIRLTIR